ncbi:MAG: hypothetical protein H0V74_07420 [Chloroflexi bacterium]|nr:hypothetical protein [Chloroflexota bacterium]
MRRMLDAAPYRGRKIRLHTEGRCSLGVASPEDLDDASIAAENGVALAVCGTIDNLGDVAARLGHRRPLPASPAAIVLAAFRELGDDTANVLRGAFSDVLTDGGSSIRAFRDHVGLGVLHYGDRGGNVYVATEARQVLAGTGSPRMPEPDFLESLLYDRYDDETLCALKGVRRLPQGSILVAGPNGVRCSRFWRPNELLETARLTTGEVQARFDELMTQAVARVLTGRDVIALSTVVLLAAARAVSRCARPRLSDHPQRQLR